MGIEPTTYGLRNRCSTTELHWLNHLICNILQIGWRAIFFLLVTQIRHPILQEWTKTRNRRLFKSLNRTTRKSAGICTVTGHLATTMRCSSAAASSFGEAGRHRIALPQRADWQSSDNRSIISLCHSVGRKERRLQRRGHRLLEQRPPCPQARHHPATGGLHQRTHALFQDRFNPQRYPAANGLAAGGVDSAVGIWQRVLGGEGFFPTSGRQFPDVSIGMPA